MDAGAITRGGTAVAPESFRAPRTVTFDSNTYRQAANPARSCRDAAPSDLLKINAALRDGRIRGYFSETIATLEGVRRADRMAVFGSTRLESTARESGPNSVTISIAVKQDRQPLPPILSKWIQESLKIGMRGLRGPARVGGIRVSDDDGTFFEPDQSVAELARRLDKANEVATAIQRRGVGYAAAVSLGLQLSARDYAVGEWWYRGLLRAQTETEQEKVIGAIAEWADGDSIASHVGYGIDLFCSADKGKKTGGAPSILDGTNRAWLSAEYGVRFVSLAELAVML
jgi:hypothetical protein